MLQETTLCYFLVKHQNKQKKIPINTFVNIVMEKTCTNFQREREKTLLELELLEMFIFQIKDLISGKQ